MGEGTQVGEKYLLLSVRNSRGCDQLVWWRENRAGYTTDLNQAGRYAKEEAERLSYRESDDWNSRGRHDIAVPESEAVKLPSSIVISVGRLTELIQRFPAKHQPRKLVEQ